MTTFNTFPDKIDCPRKECVWHDEPENKGDCLASACPFTQATRDRWFDLRAKEQSEIASMERDLKGPLDGQ